MYLRYYLKLTRIRFRNHTSLCSQLFALLTPNYEKAPYCLPPRHVLCTFWQIRQVFLPLIYHSIFGMGDLVRMPSG